MKSISAPSIRVDHAFAMRSIMGRGTEGRHRNSMRGSLQLSMHAHWGFDCWDLHNSDNGSPWNPHLNSLSMDWLGIAEYSASALSISPLDSEQSSAHVQLPLRSDLGFSAPSLVICGGRSGWIPKDYTFVTYPMDRGYMLVGQCF